MSATVLVYIMKAGHVLLAQPTAGTNLELWHGLAGTTEIGETAKMAASRVVKTTIGVNPMLQEPPSEILYHDHTHQNWKVTIFRVASYEGEIMETPTLKLQWWPVDTLPVKNMWPGDDEWLPLLVEGKPFSGEIWFDERGKVAKRDFQMISSL
jgi:ADP-ribose pyrophosphatase YjhB (NUDIX family)